MSKSHGQFTNGADNFVRSNFDKDAVPTDTSIYAASSIADIKRSLAQLSEQEASITFRLDSLIASQRDLTRELGRLDILRAQIGSQAVATRSISNGILSNAASTATRASSAVKRLDLEQGRVRSTLDVVEQVAELKTCVLGVNGSMGAPQDWERAAGYLNRASKIPKDIVNGSFAEDIVPTAEVPDPPKVTLENAAESLRGLFLREFEKAAQEGDGGRVTRFFKLFPLIGRPDVGLEVYGRYVCQGVASRARANLNAGTGGNQRKEGFFYANALTKLFEHIAQIIEHHGGLVERHYGTGRMVKVIERLQLEADVQGGIVLDTWGDERSIDRKLTDIRSYAFTFLVQSFLPQQPARSGTPRAGSPAKRGSGAEIQLREDESVDMKEVDGILSETAVMLGRWSLYSRFIADKCKELSKDKNQDLVFPPLLENSSLRRKVADRLITPFNVMTTFFFRRSVEKAFQLDEQPSDLSLNPKQSIPSNPPYITSAVDDVMYIVNQVVERSLATSQKAVILSVIPTLARVLGSDFIGMVQRKMRDESYPKATIQGAPPPEQTIIAFLVLMNNLDVATDYVKRIVQSRVEASPKTESATGSGSTSSGSLVTLFPLEHDAVIVANSLKSLQDSFECKTWELISDGVVVLFKNVIKPRLRPVLADAFRDVDYQMAQQELEDLSREAEAEGGEGISPDNTVQHHFQRGWDILTRPIMRILTERNFERLLGAIVLYLSEVLEKRIWSYYERLDDLGAVRLERDIASVVSIVVRGARYGLRDTFARCTQICLVMNMETDEWEELEAASTEARDDESDWKIDHEERTRARGMTLKLAFGLNSQLISGCFEDLERTIVLHARGLQAFLPIVQTYWAWERLMTTMTPVPAQETAMQRNTRVLKVDASRIGQIVFNNPQQSFQGDWNVQLSDNSLDAANLQEAASQLRDSDIPVAFPTETVYGLGADATRSSAVRGIYKTKGRPSDNPLIIHISSLSQLRKLITPRRDHGSTSEPPSDPILQIYHPLISRFWPGPLTILLPLPTPSPLAPEVTNSLPTVAVRMPSSMLALTLIHLAGIPLAAPSANASSKPSPTTAAHVLHDLSGRIDVILDGGPCIVGVESTVVDGLTSPPVILRPGGVSIDMLRSCPGWEDVVIGYKDGAETGVPRAPGMKYKHYSPNAKVLLFHGQMDMVSARDYIGEVRRVGIVMTKTWQEGVWQWTTNSSRNNAVYTPNGHVANGDGNDQQSMEWSALELKIEENVEEHVTIPIPSARHARLHLDEEIYDETKQDMLDVWSIALGRDTAAIARGLFSALRELDQKGVDLIFVEGINDSEGDTAAAVMNRLRKAAEAEIIL